MDDQSLSIDEDVARTERTLVDRLASAVPAFPYVELKLAVVWHLVIAVERADEHGWEIAPGLRDTWLAFELGLDHL